jgi:predicted RND superfamily exporter protein
MVIGFQDKDLFALKKFNGWYDLTEEVKKIHGIQNVLSITNLYDLKRNDEKHKFDVQPVLRQKPQTQQELDSVKQRIMSLPFYEGLAYNKETGATLMAITFEKKELDSRYRISIVQQIGTLTDKFSKDNNVTVHYSGMPYIRTHLMKKVSSEMGLFMLLAILVTAIILFILFRSFYAVFFSILVCLVGVVISLGTIVMMGYQITILSGLIPPLIMVIGVPNCIFIINKYQEEFGKHGNKMKALTVTIHKVSLSNFLANITTAIGFGVFYFTNSTLLMEFGLVAAINVMFTYVIAHALLPVIYSFLPVPPPKYLKHQDRKWINGLLDTVDHLVHGKRTLIYLITAVITLISVYGMTKINVVGYVVDDLPKKDPIYSDLRFFESNFHGVLPFEINVDTKKPNGVFSNSGKTLYKIKSLQKMMDKYPEFSKPVSAVEGLKFAYQAYNDGNPKYYILPGSLDLAKLSEYNSTIKGKENKLISFIDTTKQFTRISYQMADVGSARMKNLLSEIRPRVDTIFNYNKEENKWVDDNLKYNVMLTGHSLVFLKSNDYLLHHLFVSLLIAIVLIVLIGMALFRSIAIIILSKIPCLIPLAITAGIMGFFDIHFKASTILIFSIAFGIASDGTIYILTEYRHQLRKVKGENPASAVSRTIHELGLSMVYTNIILFFGFAIFAVSSFGGTVALGILISTTLLFSLITNFVLLPCILLSLEKFKQSRVLMQDPLIILIDEEEDIDLDKLEIQKKAESEIKD